MPIRFRRTFKIFPGVKLNVSKHGISVTTGIKGAHLTFNRYGVRQSVGLPGTGLSEQSYLIGGHQHETAEDHVQSIHQGEGRGCEVSGCGCLLLILVIFGVAIYFGANALHLHPIEFLAQQWDNLVQFLAHLWQILMTKV